MSTRAADDFNFIRARMHELDLNAGRPQTIPPMGTPGLTNPDFCGNCGTHLAQGMPHAPSCPRYVAPAYGTFCIKPGVYDEELGVYIEPD